MFKRKDEDTAFKAEGPVERITSVLGDGTNFNGRLTGSGGVRIEGAFEGEIALNGLLVIGSSGRVTCDHLQANSVIVAGALRGNITADRVEIRSTGRVWGDVTTAAFSTEDGAFLRGKIQMEEEVEMELPGDEVKEERKPAIIVEPAAKVSDEGEAAESKKTKSKPKAKKATGKSKKATKKS